jgi:hypothetical protein
MDTATKLARRAALLDRLSKVDVAAAKKDQLVALYIALRDLASEIEEDTLTPISRALESIAQEMARKLDSDGEQSASTAAGTAFFESLDSVSLSDPDQYFSWVVENAAWDMIEKRASKTGVKAFIEQHKALPPGAKFSTIRKVKFTRPRKG